ncbi:MAG TPA: glycosyltransferase family 4 protein [Rubricoccaceae bacterium]
MPRPRLAIVTSHPIQYNAPLFRLLAERGHLDLRVFYGWEGASGGGVYDRAFGKGFTWDVPLIDGYAHEFVSNRSSDPGTHHFGGLDSPDLVPRVQAFRPDAVLVYGWSFRSHLRVLRAFHGRTRVLFRGDSTLLDETAGPRRVARRVALRWVYRHVDTALYVGTNNRAYYRAHGLRDSQLVWMPHAVDNDRFADPMHEAAAVAWRGEMGIPRAAPVIVSAGKLEPIKAPEVLLNAFARLDDGLGAHLVFVGSGEMEARLRADAARSSVGERVHFAGFANQSRMPAAYRLGDVFVLPSRSETWGLATNEAMACGRPVIVSDRVGCAPDLIVEGETGWTVPAGNSDRLRGALHDALADVERLARMGRTAQTRIAEWSLAVQAAALESVLSSTPEHSA